MITIVCQILDNKMLTILKIPRVFDFDFQSFQTPNLRGQPFFMMSNGRSSKLHVNYFCSLYYNNIFLGEKLLLQKCGNVQTNSEASQKLISGSYRASGLFMIDLQEFKVQNFITLSIIPENLNILSSIVSEESSGQNDWGKNHEIGHFSSCS